MVRSFSLPRWSLFFPNEGDLFFGLGSRMGWFWLTGWSISLCFGLIARHVFPNGLTNKEMEGFLARLCSGPNILSSWVMIFLYMCICWPQLEFLGSDFVFCHLVKMLF